MAKTDTLSRREFLRSGGLAMLSLGLPLPGSTARAAPFAMGRVTTSLVYLYKEPSYLSERVGKCYRDQLLNLLEKIESDQGPAYNPRWYRVEGGYVHTAHIQRVDFRPLNEPLAAIPEYGMLGEVTVPFTRAFYRPRGDRWQPLYRLYYESVHWIKSTWESPDGSIWYKLMDNKNDGQYFVPAAHLRPISASEYSPIAQDVPPGDKRVLVSIEEQTLTAYQGDEVVLRTSIASGLPSKEVKEGDIPTDTPKGFFRITLKMPSRHMGDGRFTSEIEAYELPGVPWTMAFHDSGAALHGSFWHDNFGRRMSHGCINMRNAEALWLFRWTDPVFEPVAWYGKGLGTLIQVI